MIPYLLLVGLVILLGLILKEKHAIARPLANGFIGTVVFLIYFYALERLANHFINYSLLTIITTILSTLVIVIPLTVWSTRKITDLFKEQN